MFLLIILLTKVKLLILILDLFTIFDKRGTFIAHYFQQSVNAKVFKIIFNDFKPGVDYNNQHFKIINEHYPSIM